MSNCGSQGPGVSKAIRKVIAGYVVVRRTTPKPNPTKKKEGKQYQGQCPFEDWQIDFTQMPRLRGWKYLLTFVDTFSGWVEAYLNRTEKSSEVVKALLKEIIPHFGLPDSIQSDNGPAFVLEITQKVSKILGIKWRLHTAWRPQTSGKIEKMNHTLKKKYSQNVNKLIFIGIKLYYCRAQDKDGSSKWDSVESL
ncbi:hypothetical protein HJG60_010954 [Phyllostomus discolor]|uniref:Integrase catalytic domain-containing protein n=1 Tax=Phyllostomus discolor TaxID=89673 RepID=A0A834EAD1_9CHIR|nr:hypothetical protein HJG60_010954 [Phyllostomus discolor]